MDENLDDLLGQLAIDDFAGEDGGEYGDTGTASYGTGAGSNFGDMTFDDGGFGSQTMASDTLSGLMDDLNDLENYDGTYDPNAAYDANAGYDPNAGFDYDPNAGYDASYDAGAYDEYYDQNAGYDPNAAYDPNAGYDAYDATDPNAGYQPEDDLTLLMNDLQSENGATGSEFVSDSDLDSIINELGSDGFVDTTPKKKLTADKKANRRTALLQDDDLSKLLNELDGDAEAAAADENLDMLLDALQIDDNIDEMPPNKRATLKKGIQLMKNSGARESISAENLDQLLNDLKLDGFEEVDDSNTKKAAPTSGAAKPNRPVSTIQAKPAQARPVSVIQTNANAKPARPVSTIQPNPASKPAQPQAQAQARPVSVIQPKPAQSRPVSVIQQNPNASKPARPVSTIQPNPTSGGAKPAQAQAQAQARPVSVIQPKPAQSRPVSVIQQNPNASKPARPVSTIQPNPTSGGAKPAQAQAQAQARPVSVIQPKPAQSRPVSVIQQNPNASKPTTAATTAKPIAQSRPVSTIQQPAGNRQSTPPVKPTSISADEVDSLLFDLGGGPPKTVGKPTQQQQAGSRASVKPTKPTQPSARQTPNPPTGEIDSLIDALGGDDGSEDLGSLMERLDPSQKPKQQPASNQPKGKAAAPPPKDDLEDLIDQLSNDDVAPLPVKSPPTTKTQSRAQRPVSRVPETEELLALMDDLEVPSRPKSNMKTGRSGELDVMINELGNTSNAGNRRTVQQRPVTQSFGKISSEKSSPNLDSLDTRVEDIMADISGPGGRGARGGRTPAGGRGPAHGGRAPITGGRGTTGGRGPAPGGRGAAPGGRGPAGRGPAGRGPAGRAGGRGPGPALPPGTCSACRKQIQGRRIDAMGRSYHPEHFMCSSCNRVIGEESFFTVEFQPQCYNCHRSVFCEKCAHCNQPITDNVVTAMGYSWHSHCWACTNCNVPFNGSIFFEIDQRPYCQKCHGEVFGECCKRCNAVIKGSSMTAANASWHEKCFNCNTCHKSLGGGFYEKNGEIYCSDHY
eukprot:TRINITY_DN432_c0_g1_i1.p1 TRINITY_DN432_c0_g1~~TRINITY_DN432_c0_g1_i1.p1  ORF type:complete len:1019 (-),score=330.68 TRINITY_DN432_c0_g1_i1:44-3100(-)